MAAEIGHQRGESIVVVTLDQRTRIGAQIGVQPSPPCRAALIGERSVIGIGAAIDPLAQCRAAVPGERLDLALAVLQRDDAPSARLEDVVEAAEHAVSGRGVERLTVIVHYPPAIADVVLVRLDQAFVDVALVELGVAHQRHHPPDLAFRQPPMREKIVLDEAGERGDRHAEPDRAGREIDRDAVLGPAGIALHATQRAKALELIERLVAGEIMRRVQQRTRMGLHRHPILRAQRMKVEHRHDRGHRRARRLMATHLQPVAALAQVVRIVDRPRAQPAQPRVQDRQRVMVRASVRNGGKCGFRHHILSTIGCVMPARPHDRWRSRDRAAQS